MVQLDFAEKYYNYACYLAHAHLCVFMQIGTYTHRIKSQQVWCSKSHWGNIVSWWTKMLECRAGLSMKKKLNDVHIELCVCVWMHICLFVCPSIIRLQVSSFLFPFLFFLFQFQSKFAFWDFISCIFPIHSTHRNVSNSTSVFFIYRILCGLS